MASSSQFNDTIYEDDSDILPSDQGTISFGDQHDSPVYGPYSDYYIYQVNFWVEGVVQTLLAVPGFIGKRCRQDSTILP